MIGVSTGEVWSLQGREALPPVFSPATGENYFPRPGTSGFYVLAPAALLIVS